MATLKSTAFVAAVAILSAAFCVAANATGRPSVDEAPAPQVSAAQQDPQLGSYARYLMLSGLTRDEAIVQAAPYDRPAPHPFVQRFAFAHARPATPAAAPATVRQ